MEKSGEKPEIVIVDEKEKLIDELIGAATNEDEKLFFNLLVKLISLRGVPKSKIPKDIYWAVIIMVAIRGNIPIAGTVGINRHTVRMNIESIITYINEIPNNVTDDMFYTIIDNLINSIGRIPANEGVTLSKPSGNISAFLQMIIRLINSLDDIESVTEMAGRSSLINKIVSDLDLRGLPKDVTAGKVYSILLTRKKDGNRLLANDFYGMFKLIQTHLFTEASKSKYSGSENSPALSTPTNRRRRTTTGLRIFRKEITPEELGEEERNVIGFGELPNVVSPPVERNIAVDNLITQGTYEQEAPIYTFDDYDRNRDEFAQRYATVKLAGFNMDELEGEVLKAFRFNGHRIRSEDDLWLIINSYIADNYVKSMNFNGEIFKAIGRERELQQIHSVSVVDDEIREMIRERIRFGVVKNDAEVEEAIREYLNEKRVRIVKPALLRAQQIGVPLSPVQLRGKPAAIFTDNFSGGSNFNPLIGSSRMHAGEPSEPRPNGNPPGEPQIRVTPEGRIAKALKIAKATYNGIDKTYRGVALGLGIYGTGRAIKKEIKRMKKGDDDSGDGDDEEDPNPSSGNPILDEEKLRELESENQKKLEDLGSASKDESVTVPEGTKVKDVIAYGGVTVGTLLSSIAANWQYLTGAYVLNNLRTDGSVAVGILVYVFITRII